MTSFAIATQISWTLQAAIAMTFAVALLGLAVQLKRPATTDLAAAWLWTTLSLTSIAVDSFIDPTYTAVVPTLLLGGLTLACMAASMPAFDSAVDRLRGVHQDQSRSAVMRRSTRWAVAAYLMLAALVALATGPFATVERFVGIGGRALIMLLYLRLSIRVLIRKGDAPARFRGVLNLFAAAVTLQGVRPIFVLALISRGREADMSDHLAIAFVGLHVFAGTAFGVACLLMALAEERTEMLSTGHQLRDAALRLERSHRLESVGRLASGVAHDFNNLLTVISSSAELARQANRGIAHVDVELAEIEKAAERGADLTRQLLAFARRQPQHVVVFDACERTHRMTSLLERLVGRHIALEVQIQPQPALVEMDPSTFEQVVLNLVANAREAIANGGAETGRIVVTAAATVLATTRPYVDGELSPGRYVSLTVADSGRGIDAAVLDRIFEPFFTTRLDDGGTGLGLATVQNIARLAGGDVSVESPTGEGAIFTVLLPAVELRFADLPPTR